MRATRERAALLLCPSGLRYFPSLSCLLCLILLFQLCCAPSACAKVALERGGFVSFGMYRHAKTIGDEYAPSYDPAPSSLLWQVRSADAISALFLTHYIIDCKQWSSADFPGKTLLPEDAWTKSSDLCVFLNDTGEGGFLEHFTSAEQALMSTSFAPGVPVQAGRATLASVGEMSGGILGFDGNGSRSADYRGGAHQEKRLYWLRSAGNYNGAKAAYVSYDGTIVKIGKNVGKPCGVRPVSQISLAPAAFKTGSGRIDDPYKLYVKWDSPPVLSVTGGKLKLAFPDDIASADRWPSPDDFTLSYPAGMIVDATPGAADRKSLILSPDRAIELGSRVELTYSSSVCDAGGRLLKGAVARSGDMQAMTEGKWSIEPPVINPVPPPPPEPNPTPPTKPNPEPPPVPVPTNPASVAEIPSADGSLRAVIVVRDTNGGIMDITEIAPGADNDAAMEALKNMGLSAAVANNEVVISGTAADIGTVVLHLSVAGSAAPVPVVFTVLPIECSAAPVICADPAAWEALLWDYGFQLFIPMNLPAEDAARVADVSVSVAGASIGSVGIELKEQGGRSGIPRAIGEGRVGIKIAGTTGDPNAVIITGVAYRIGIRRYTQDLDVKLTDASIAGGLDASVSGGCAAGGFAVVFLVIGAALFCKLSAHRFPFFSK